MNEKLKSGLRNALKEGAAKAKARKIIKNLTGSVNKILSVGDKPEGSAGKMTEDQLSVEPLTPNDRRIDDSEEDEVT